MISIQWVVSSVQYPDLVACGNSSAGGSLVLRSALQTVDGIEGSLIFWVEDEGLAVGVEGFFSLAGGFVDLGGAEVGR